MYLAVRETTYIIRVSEQYYGENTSRSEGKECGITKKKCEIRVADK